MPSIDIFNDNAFNLSSLSAAIEKAPHKPRLLGSLGIFQEEPIYTTTAWVEERNHTLALISTAARGAVDNVRSAPTRSARAFKVPHVPYFQGILADDIQNLRAFGSETELQIVSSYVNDQLIGMRNDHEVTHEWHRLGALKGVVYDADTTTVIYDYFNEFGISQNTQNWTYATAGGLNTLCNAVIREIGGALGNTMFGQIYAICGDTYFDNLTKHADIDDAYDRWRDGEFRRVSHLGPDWYTLAANGFMFQNILFVNYRGAIGGTKFVADNEAYYFPSGVPQLFKEVIAPADFMETVNTKGKRVYAKQERMPFDKGVTLHTQSNVLAICTRPAAVIKSTGS